MTMMKKYKTSDGKILHISHDPNAHIDQETIDRLSKLFQELFEEDDEEDENDGI